jgi:hypothetical protein
LFLTALPFAHASSAEFGGTAARSHYRQESRKKGKSNNKDAGFSTKRSEHNTTSQRMLRPSPAPVPPPQWSLHTAIAAGSNSANNNDDVDDEFRLPSPEWEFQDLMEVVGGLKFSQDERDIIPQVAAGRQHAFHHGNQSAHYTDLGDSGDGVPFLTQVPVHGRQLRASAVSREASQAATQEDDDVLAYATPQVAPLRPLVVEFEWTELFPVNLFEERLGHVHFPTSAQLWEHFGQDELENFSRALVNAISRERNDLQRSGRPFLIRVYLRGISRAKLQCMQELLHLPENFWQGIEFF